MNLCFLGYTGSVQQAASGNVSLVVSQAGSAVLIDVSGAPVLELRKAGVDPHSLVLVVLTHTHVDHVYGLPSLLHQLWLMGRKAPLAIVGNGVTIATARSLCDVFGLEQKNGMFPLVWTVVEEGRYDGDLNGMDLHLFPVPHGVPTIGCSFTCKTSRIVYLSDGIPAQEYPEVASDADLLIHEAGGTVDQEAVLTKKGHSSARQAAQDALRLHAKRLLLCHLPEQSEAYHSILAEAQAIFNTAELPMLQHVYEV